MPDKSDFPIPVATDQEIADFLARYGKPYDPETDTYHRDPFIADIREGKNDPIYNAHSYHTKVPPRAIIPYILHYTEPGDIILDPFCGSGMTGVAALMCEDPPEDLLKMVPGAKKGARRAILNDLSPAACHIAYNYCTPVDVAALKAEFERIKAAVKEEFDWLYGTEHYEPAVGLYDPANPEVARRLKSPLAPLAGKGAGGSGGDGLRVSGGESLIPSPDEDRTWELLDRAEVEHRTGPEALAKQPLPDGVEQFICIPATIQYTIWSDVYKCQGMVTIEEPTGRISTRGKNAGKPIVRKKRVPRGCGANIVLWYAAVEPETGEVRESFQCPSCNAEWKKTQIPRIGERPVLSRYEHLGRRQVNGKISLASLRGHRATTAREHERLSEIVAKPVPYWFPDFDLDRKAPQYRRNALSRRLIFKVSDFYTKRNLWSQSRLWHEFNSSKQQQALRFLFTALTNGMTRRSAYSPGETPRATPMIKGSLYIPSFSAEWNPLSAIVQRLRKTEAAFAQWTPSVGKCAVLLRDATSLPLPDECIDYVFTDPPFGSNIYYSEMSMVWEAWLGDLMNRKLEAVVHRKNDGGFKRLPDYEAIMTKAFAEMARVLKPGRHATVEFNNSDGEVFEAIKRAVRTVGFEIENMIFLDKVQKSFKQLKGEKGEEDVVGHDVIFNLRKPASVVAKPNLDHTLTEPEKNQAQSYLRQQLQSVGKTVSDVIEHIVVETTREHLKTLPERIQAYPKTYSDEHRTTPFLNTMLMNALIPKGINVEQLNLPFIEAICTRYFRRVDNRWFLPDEVVGNHRPGRQPGALFQPADGEVAIKDETTAIEWLRQRFAKTPMRIGELRPHWMRATVMLTGDLSTRLEQFLRENFWLDRQTRRWREPTDSERAQMDNIERQRARDEAERFLAGTLRRHPTGDEILDWIGHLYASASLIEDEAVGLSDTGDAGDLPADAARLYGMMPRLFQAVLKETVEAQRYALAQRQCRIASTKLTTQAEREAAREKSKGASEEKLPLFASLNSDE